MAAMEGAVAQMQDAGPEPRAVVARPLHRRGRCSAVAAERRSAARRDSRLISPIQSKFQTVQSGIAFPIEPVKSAPSHRKWRKPPGDAGILGHSARPANRLSSIDDLKTAIHIGRNGILFRSGGRQIRAEHRSRGDDDAARRPDRALSGYAARRGRRLGRVGGVRDAGDRLLAEIGGRTRRYAGTSHIDVAALGASEAEDIVAALRAKGLGISALGYYPNPLHPDLGHRQAVIDHLNPW